MNSRLYPEWDEFYLLVCDICGIIIRPQALEKHLAKKHRTNVNNVSNNNHTSTTTTTTTPTPTPTPITTKNNDSNNTLNNKSSAVTAASTTSNNHVSNNNNHVVSTSSITTKSKNNQHSVTKQNNSNSKSNNSIKLINVKTQKGAATLQSANHQNNNNKTNNNNHNNLNSIHSNTSHTPATNSPQLATATATTTILLTPESLASSQLQALASSKSATPITITINGSANVKSFVTTAVPASSSVHPPMINNNLIHNSHIKTHTTHPISVITTDTANTTNVNNCDTTSQEQHRAAAAAAAVAVANNISQQTEPRLWGGKHALDLIPRPAVRQRRPETIFSRYQVRRWRNTFNVLRDTFH